MKTDNCLADTITIREHQAQEVQSTGADLRCEYTGRRKKEGPAPVWALRDVLIDKAGFPKDCLTVSSISQQSDFGCFLAAAVVGAIIAVGGVILSDLQFSVPALIIIGFIAALVAAIGWFFFRSTLCQFVIHCSDAEAVESAHTAIAEGGDEIRVHSTDWRYEVDSDSLTEWSTKCIERARARAEVVARSLGVRITGLFSYDEAHDLPTRHHTPPELGGDVMCDRDEMVSEQKSLFPAGDPAHILTDQERVVVHVTVRYRVTQDVPEKEE